MDSNPKMTKDDEQRARKRMSQSHDIFNSLHKDLDDPAAVSTVAVSLLCQCFVCYHITDLQMDGVFDQIKKTVSVLRRSMEQRLGH